jgi:large subunit ribosomal protein L22
MRKDIPTSPWKLNLVAKQIRGMSVDDALAQLQFSPKKAAVYISKVIKQTKLNAEVNNGVADGANMHIFESYVGKGNNMDRIRYHAQGRSGTVRVFQQKFTLEDAIGSHACSLEASSQAIKRVTNGIPLGCPLFLPVHTGNCVQTLKAELPNLEPITT